VLTGLALLCSLIDWFRAPYRSRYTFIYPLLLLCTWILGFINALIHAKDAWATMPESLVLSVIVTILIGVTAWVGLTGCHTGGAK
jgi:uncharacterized membrane protein